jgi:hypothetical protein
MLEASLVMQSCVGTCWAPALLMLLEACLSPPDVRGLPTCRSLDVNSLTGTLPKEWSTMSNLTYL